MLTTHVMYTALSKITNALLSDIRNQNLVNVSRVVSSFAQ